MSFDIFLVSLGGNFPLALVEKAFAPCIESRTSGSWRLSGSLAEVWIDDGPMIGDFMVSRPPGDEHHPFWKGLLEIMQQTETVLHWPSIGPKPYCVVASEAVILHMPADMVETLGRPKIVTTPEEFWEFIIESGA